jgi:hypothetical protein
MCSVEYPRKDNSMEIHVIMPPWKPTEQMEVETMEIPWRHNHMDFRWIFKKISMEFFYKGYTSDKRWPSCKAALDETVHMEPSHRINGYQKQQSQPAAGICKECIRHSLIVLIPTQPI